MRALRRGPAAVIRALPSVSSKAKTPAPPAVAIEPGPAGFLPEYDATPSAFPVALRADLPEPEEAGPRAEPAVVTKPEENVPAAPLAVEPPSTLSPRLVAYAVLLLGLVYVTLRFLLAR
jgi:hypothetical protein